MPPPPSPTSSSPSYAAVTQSSTVSSPRSWLWTPWLPTPYPIRVLFSYFPLKSLSANSLPERTLQAEARKKHTLFIFTSANSIDGDAHLVPSFNPTCLKWQTYMLMHDVEFRVASSNNHASPSGALPFLIPAEGSQEDRRKRQARRSENKDAATTSRGNRDRTGNDSAPSLVTTSSLESWILGQSKRSPERRNASENMRCEAYLSLIEHRIRPAWVSHVLKHSPSNPPFSHSLASPNSSAFCLTATPPPFHVTFMTRLTPTSRSSTRSTSPPTSTP